MSEKCPFCPGKLIEVNYPNYICSSCVCPWCGEKASNIDVASQSNGGYFTVEYYCGSSRTNIEGLDGDQSSRCKDRQIANLQHQNQALRKVLEKVKLILEVVKGGHFETVGYMADKPEDKTYSWRIQADFNAVKQATLLLTDIDRLEKGEGK